MKTQNQNNLLRIVKKIEDECSDLSDVGQQYEVQSFRKMIKSNIVDLIDAIYKSDYDKIAKLSTSLKEEMEERARTSGLSSYVIRKVIEIGINPLFKKLDKTALLAQREENQTPLQNLVVQGFKDGSISLSTLRLLKTSMSAEELKVFVNSEIDDKGNRMLHLTKKKEIADFLISAGASKIGKNYVESQNTSTGPSKMKERLENRDNIPDFHDVPKTTSQFGNVKSQSTLNKGSETIRMTETQFELLDNLTDPKASIVKFKEIMEGNSGKFFRDNINADLDGKGNTLLHLVKNEDIREYLIAEHKANPRARNNEGKTYDGLTDSKEKKFVPNTKLMDTLKFEKDEPQRPPLESKKTQYGQLLSNEALDAQAKPIPTPPKKQEKPMTAPTPKVAQTVTVTQTVVTTTTQVPSPTQILGGTAEQIKLIHAVVEALKSGNATELKVIFSKEENQFIKDKINLPFNKRGVKLADHASNKEVAKILQDNGAEIDPTAMNKLPKVELSKPKAKKSILGKFTNLIQKVTGKSNNHTL
jgi:hypothetical protein